MVFSGEEFSSQTRYIHAPVVFTGCRELHVPIPVPNSPQGPHHCHGKKQQKLSGSEWAIQPMHRHGRISQSQCRAEAGTQGSTHFVAPAHKLKTQESGRWSSQRWGGGAGKGTWVLGPGNIPILVLGVGQCSLDIFHSVCFSLCVLMIHALLLLSMKLRKFKEEPQSIT